MLRVGLATCTSFVHKSIQFALSSNVSVTSLFIMLRFARRCAACAANTTPQAGQMQRIMSLQIGCSTAMHRGTTKLLGNRQDRVIVSGVDVMFAVQHTPSKLAGQRHLFFLSISLSFFSCCPRKPRITNRPQ